jgi:hypothetical protein
MIPYKAKANSAVVNQYLMSRTADTSTSGKVGLQNVAPESGAAIVNLQRAVNSFASAMGMSTSDVYNFLFTWASNDVGTATDTIKQRIDALVAKFSITGHAHTGVAGDAPKISSDDFAQFNNFFSSYASTTFNAASGLNSDVSTAFAAKTPGGSTASYGVVTIAPNNRVDLIDADDGTFVQNGSDRVYAYLTESSGVWTLTYYYMNAGVETAYNLPSTDLVIVFREVFSAETRPTFDATQPSQSVTMNITADVDDASPTQRGLVNTVSQSFAGEKSFADFRATANLLASQSNDNTAVGVSGTVAAPTTPVVRLTNNTLVSIAMINNATSDRVLILINATGVDVDVLNDTGATPSNRILTGTGTTMKLAADACVWLAYDSTSTRWRVIGGSGGGSSVIIDTTANIAGMPRSAGALYFDTDVEQYFGDDGTALIPLASVPSAGLVKSDGAVLSSIADGNEAEVLTMFGGAKSWRPANSGVKNYFPKGNADQGSYGSVYADGATAPVDGTGGSPTSSVALSSASPLSGGNSFRYTSGVLGDGYSADSNVMDRKDFTKVFKVEVNYRLISGTYADGDLKLFLLDTSNSNAPLMITPNNSLSKPIGYDRFEAFVQLPVQTSPSALRFCLHQTTTATFVMDFEFSLSEQAFAGYGPIVKDWNSDLMFGASSGFGTPTSVNIQSKRFGDTLKVSGSFLAGTVTATGAWITLPPGIEIDYSKFPVSRQVGRSYLMNSATFVASENYGPHAMYVDGSDTGKVFISGWAANGASTTSFGNLPVNQIFSNGNGIQFDFEIPVVGWSSESRVISEYDGSPVSVAFSNNANLLTSAATTIIFNTLNKDTTGIHNISTGETLIKITGRYRVNARGINSTGDYLFVYKNGVKIGNAICHTASASNVEFGSGEFDFVKGDVITIRPDSGATLNFSSGYYAPMIEINLLPNFQRILSESNVDVQYYLGANQSISAGVTVTFDTKVVDTLGTSIVNGVFTAEHTGPHLVTTTIYAIGGAGYMYIRRTGSSTLAKYLMYVSSMACGSTVIDCVKGDTLEIRSDSAFNIGGGLGSGAVDNASFSSISIKLL